MGGETANGGGLGPRLQVLAAAALFSTGGAAIKAVHLTGVQVASLRSGIAAVTLLLILPAARRRPTGKALAVGVAHALTMVLFVLANKLTTSASTIFLQDASPLYILLLRPWLLQEPIRRRDVGFMVVLGAGLSLFFLGLDPASATAPDPLRGDWMAILSGLFWAFTVVGFRFLGRGNGGAGGAGEGGGAATAAVLGNVFACLFCLPAALPISAMTAARPVDWAILGYLGVFQIGLAYFFLTRALEKVPAFEAALLLLLEPVLTPIWSWLLHGERPSPWTFAGGGMILAATMIKSWLDVRERVNVSDPRG